MDTQEWPDDAGVLPTNAQDASEATLRLSSGAESFVDYGSAQIVLSQ